MKDKMEVKEHLHNQVLYEQTKTIGSEWKQKLFRQYALQQQLKNALKERPSFLNYSTYLGTIIICLTFAFASYMGSIDPAYWYDNFVEIIKFYIPAIGMKEALIFVIAVNGLTFIIRKRA